MSTLFNKLATVLLCCGLAFAVTGCGTPGESESPREEATE